MTLLLLYVSSPAQLNFIYCRLNAVRVFIKFARLKSPLVEWISNQFDSNLRGRIIGYRDLMADRTRERVSEKDSHRTGGPAGGENAARYLIWRIINYFNENSRDFTAAELRT